MAINMVNGLRFGNATLNWLRSKKWSDYIVWCRIPQSFHALNVLNPRAVIYDVTDDYSYYGKTKQESALTDHLEARLAARANQVFTTTEDLRRKLSGLTSARADVIPNGVASTFFDVRGADPLKAWGKPRIGYVGLIADWMDFEILARLGRRWPGQIFVVGPAKPEVAARLNSIPGLVCTGAVGHEDVPLYLSAFDVCIMPHLTSELRHRADPLKIVEYLSTGKPIVSSRLRPLERLHPLVDLADTPQQFEQLVAERLTDPRLDLAAARIAEARSRSWDNIFEIVAQRIECLPCSRAPG